MFLHQGRCLNIRIIRFKISLTFSNFAYITNKFVVLNEKSRQADFYKGLIYYQLPKLE